MRGARARIVVLVLGLGFLAVLAACPPKPPINPGPDADAAAAPKHATCSAAAKHYAAVCSKSDVETTTGLCYSEMPNIPRYADCLAKAKDCGAGKACGGGADAGASGKKPVNGR